MTFACFILSALDILGVLQERTSLEERKNYVDWIYHCQHPSGGFRGFTGTISGDAGTEAGNGWDPANLGGTFFALCALAVLGDGLERVKRRECLDWVTRLQVEDGSFGEVLGQSGEVEGKQDIRFAYLAASIRWILRDEHDERKDIDVEKLFEFVHSSRTYDGGIAKAPLNEAHAGCTYCGIGTLDMIGKLQSVDPTSLQDTFHWLVSRQTSHIEEEDEEKDYEVTEDVVLPSQSAYEQLSRRAQLENPHHASVPHDILAAGPLARKKADGLKIYGINGRCNKVADTCYSWWVGGTLGILKAVHLQDLTMNKRYLLEKMQHIIGGFSKLPGDPPDMLHSYLGLAALANLGGEEEGLEKIDAVLCISMRARRHLETLPWRRKGNQPSPSEEVNDAEGKEYVMISGG
ncbi:MAG: hypothetical protein MMC33_010578 [Icmadophila ericetorum]|nr:hypothetical protein [Icmadophila ericetorum]